MTKKTTIAALSFGMIATAFFGAHFSQALPIVLPTPSSSPSASLPPPNTIHPIPAASSAVATAGEWQIHPRNVPDQCLQYLVEPGTGTNSSGGPTYITYAYVATCSSGFANLHIANASDGSPWGGSSGDVIIASTQNVGSVNIGCLENPLRMPTPAPTSPVGTDGIDAQWYACATGQGVDPQAQRFYINTGASGTVGPFSIDSSLEYALNYPNPKLESLNEYDPRHIRFEPYSGLRNWEASRVGG
ncbi:MAG: hypothetical protein ACXVCH_17675 [Bdellovibrionota bacterium]